MLCIPLCTQPDLPPIYTRNGPCHQLIVILGSCHQARMLWVPKPDGSVVRCRCKELAIGRECYYGDYVQVALVSAVTDSCRRVPKPDGFIVRSRCKELYHRARMLL